LVDVGLNLSFNTCQRVPPSEPPVIEEAGDVYKDSLDDNEIELPRALTTLEKRGRHITKRAG
jgi:hypothetical protein